jgi:hypothetical protein
MDDDLSRVAHSLDLSWERGEARELGCTAASRFIFYVEVKRGRSPRLI